MRAQLDTISSPGQCYQDVSQQAASPEPVTFQRTSRIMNRILNHIENTDNLCARFTNTGWGRSNV